MKWSFSGLHESFEFYNTNSTFYGKRACRVSNVVARLISSFHLKFHKFQINTYMYQNSCYLTWKKKERIVLMHVAEFSEARCSILVTEYSIIKIVWQFSDWHIQLRLQQHFGYNNKIFKDFNCCYNERTVVITQQISYDYNCKIN